MEDMGLKVSLENAYKGKKVFVTGHTGFKGIWLTALLNKLGAKVKGYALEPDSSRSFFDLFGSSLFEESVIGDILDKQRLEQEIDSFEPDFIFHLAAQSLVLRSYEIPSETFNTNVMGTANLLEALFKIKRRVSVIVVTTDKVYENKESGIHFKETDRLGGHDPYSASKACTEMVVESFRKAFFLCGETVNTGVATVRAGNVIGGGDWNTNRIVPDIVRSLKKMEPIIVRNPNAIRPWQHVLEPLTGYLILASHLYDYPLKYSGAYNFGPFPKDHVKVFDLVNLAIENWGYGSIDIDESNQKFHEANLLQLDITKAIENLGWRPKLSSKDAIIWTMDWYKKEIDGQAQLTFEQIHKFLEL